MDNITLDNILLFLAENPREKVDTSLILSRFNLEGGQWNNPEIEFMNSRGLVRMDREQVPHPSKYEQLAYPSYSTTVQITPSGIRFINEGGFRAETRYRDETLQVAKDSRKYAKWAFWISLAGVLVTIAIYLRDRL